MPLRRRPREAVLRRLAQGRVALAARAGREAAEEELGRDVPFSLLLVVYYSDHRQREVAKERQGCGGTRLELVLERMGEELVEPILQMSVTSIVKLEK